jgi:hypothetical protein
MNFMPIIECPKERIAKGLLWMLHKLGICCVIAGMYAMYLTGKLASHPDLISTYMANYPQSSPLTFPFIAIKAHCRVFFRLIRCFVYARILSTWYKFLLHYKVRSTNYFSQNCLRTKCQTMRPAI